MIGTRSTRPELSRTRAGNDGFTIVEVFIVLAIAGVIMLLIFMAIPQLARNQRNGTRSQDVAVILNAVSRYQLNNSGAFPNCGSSAATSCFASISGNPPVLDQSKIHFYDVSASSVSVLIQPQTPLAVVGPSTNLQVVAVYNYQKCDPDNPGKATSASAGFTDIVALYAVETGSGTATSQCQEQ